jgi:hypothetical protein
MTLLKRSLVAATIILASSGGAGVIDPLDQRMNQLGPNAADCGSTSEGAANRGAVNACVIEHVLKSKPFRARFAVRCEDSKCATGLVLESQSGSLYIVTYDSEGCHPDKASDPFCGTALERCQKPTIASQGKGLRLLCKNEYSF